MAMSETSVCVRERERMIEERIKRDRETAQATSVSHQVSRKHTVLLMATTHVSASSAWASDVGVHVASCCSPSTSARCRKLAVNGYLLPNTLVCGLPFAEKVHQTFSASVLYSLVT